MLRPLSTHLMCLFVVSLGEPLSCVWGSSRLSFCASCKLCPGVRSPSARSCVSLSNWECCRSFATFSTTREAGRPGRKRRHFLPGPSVDAWRLSSRGCWASRPTHPNLGHAAEAKLCVHDGCWRWIRFMVYFVRAAMRHAGSSTIDARSELCPILLPL